MVRIHPDPPVNRRPGSEGTKAGAVAQLGERLLCKQEAVGSIPSGSTSQESGVRGQKSAKASPRSSSLSIAVHNSIQLRASATECKAERCSSLTIREGKAHSGLDESSGCEGLSCILPGRARQKALDRVAQTRS